MTDAALAATALRERVLERELTWARVELAAYVDATWECPRCAGLTANTSPVCLACGYRLA